MKFHEMAIIIVVVSMLLIGSTLYIGDLSNHYGSSADTSKLTNNTLERMNKQHRDMKDIQGNFTKMTLNEGGVAAYTMPFVMISTAWSAIKVMFESWTTLPYVITDLNNALPPALRVPEWVTLGIFTMIIVILVAMIIYAFFKWRVEN